MKHIFVINPASGKGKTLDIMKAKIAELCRGHGLERETYITTGPGDAITFCRTRAAQEPDERLRFYACGGDGTVYEVVNGMWDASNAEFAVIPLGSGNDFIRLFGSKELFLDIDNVIQGTPVTLDVIRVGEQIAVNQCSMGFDAEACDKQGRYKKIPGVPGEFAYVLGVLATFCGRVGYGFEITVDGVRIDKGTSMLCYIGNSRWYGGGFQAGPRAMPNDGLLDIMTVTKTATRFSLAPMFLKLKNGQHLDMPATTYVRGKKVHIKTDRPAIVNVDGECDRVNEATFELLENAVTFVVPRGSLFFDLRKSWEKDEQAHPILPLEARS